MEETTYCANCGLEIVKEVNSEVWRGPYRSDDDKINPWYICIHDTELAKRYPTFDDWQRGHHSEGNPHGKHEPISPLQLLCIRTETERRDDG